MANVLFKKGSLANLPQTKVAGTIYVTTDERAMYLDTDNNTRIRLGDFQEYANWAAIQALPDNKKISTVLYYAQAENILCKWTGTAWTQINPDTICKVTNVAQTTSAIIGGVSVTTSVTDDKSTKSAALDIVGGSATTVSRTAGTAGNPDIITITSTDTHTNEAGHYVPSTEDTSKKVSAQTSNAITAIKLDSNKHVIGIEQESFANIASQATISDVTVDAVDGSATGAVGLSVGVSTPGGSKAGSVDIKGSGATTVTKTDGTGNDPDIITITSTDQSVTAVGNHYTPTGGTTSSATGATGSAGSTVQVVTGITKDAAGHVTGITSGAATDTQNAMQNITVATATGTNTGFTISAQTDYGSAVADVLDPVITVGDTTGSNTTTDIKFGVNGKATLPVYTKVQTDDAITTALGAANAMVIKGDLSSASSTLPTSNVQAGDTYIVTYASGLSINGETAEPGDLFIAKADMATSTAANWYYVPAGNDLAYFSAAGAGEEGIALKTKADNVISGKLLFASAGTTTVGNQTYNEPGIVASASTDTSGDYNVTTMTFAMQWGEF